MNDSNPITKNISSSLSEHEDFDFNQEDDKTLKKKNTSSLNSFKNEEEDQNASSFSKVPPEKPLRKARTLHLPVPANQDVIELIEHDQDEFGREVLQGANQNILKTGNRIRKIIKQAEKNGNSTIIQAISDGYIDMIVPLAFKGHDVNIKDDKGRSPLYLAILRGQTQLSLQLLHLKASMLNCDSQGRVPLHIAALVNNRRVADIMIKQGALVDSQDEQMVTPLMIAAQKGALATLYILLLGNADGSLKDHHGKTALDHANENNYSAIAGVLSKKTSKVLLEYASTENIITERQEPLLPNEPHANATGSGLTMESIGLPSEGSKSSIKTVQNLDICSNDQISSPISVSLNNSDSNIKTFCSKKKSELKKMFVVMQKLDKRLEEDSIEGMEKAYLKAQKIELKSKMDQTKKKIEQVSKKL